MKNKTIIFVLASLLFLSSATTSHAITITGTETITTNSSASYSAEGCNGTVSWGVIGTGASISSNGVLTTMSASCGGITVTAHCSDDSIATKTARVTNAGRWIETSSCGFVPSGCGAFVGSLVTGKYSYTMWFNAGYSASCADEFNTACCQSDCPPPFVPTGLPPNWVVCCSYRTVTAEWQCLLCTNGQTISCYTGTGGTQGIGECKAGTQTCTNGQWGACVGEVLPSPEICGDKLDNNCDGNVDEGCETCEVSVKISPLAIWPQKTESAETTAIVTVSPTKPVPPAGCNIKLSVEPVKNSGGHIEEGHSGTRHKGTINPSSFIIEGGMVAVLSTYKSSEVAGIEKIKVEVNGKETTETNIKVQVPGLMPLSGGYYFLKCDIESCAGYKHTDFYNVQSWVNGLFTKIAYSYHQKFPTSQLLVVTDASLAYGGLYDYQNTWAPPHKTHRVGTDIDVRSKNISKGQQRKDFERFVCDNYGSPKLEFSGQMNEHYHLYFFPYKNLPKNLCEGEVPI